MKLTRSLLCALAFGLWGNLPTLSNAKELEHYDLEKVPGIQRAALDVLWPEGKAVAVLLLFPGQNGDARPYLKDSKWIDFGTTHQIVLVGVTLKSEDVLLEQGKGYTRPALGSGNLIQEGLKKAELDRYPQFLHGFSAGAQIVSRYAELYPEQILAWSAYSMASYDPPLGRGELPFGIVSCGELDGTRYGTDLSLFKEGRALGRRWTWVSVRNKSHEPSPELENFVRKYFSEILREPKIKGVWIDAQTLQLRAGPQAGDTELSWLPSAGLLEFLRSFANH